MIKQELQIFFAALTFFTRLPSPLSQPEHYEEYLNKAARYFPLVGWVVGGISALVILVGGAYFPDQIAILLSMIISILVTGAFHEDGFADTCDGFGGGWSKERILDIMKDSRIGAFGTIGLIMVLASKFFVLSEIPIHYLPWVLIAGHSVSRLASTYCIYSHEYVGNDGTSKAKPLCSSISKKEMMVAAITGIIPVLLLDNFWYFTVLAPVFIATWWMSRYFKKWIGGYTGDGLGAIQQVSEVVFYLSVLFLRENIV